MDLNVFQTNASGIFQENHWYISFIHLITALRCFIFQSIEGSEIYNVTKTMQGPKITFKFLSD
jgi:hypothetical protein